MKAAAFIIRKLPCGTDPDEFAVSKDGKTLLCPTKTSARSAS